MAGSIPNNGTNTKNYSLRNRLQWYWDLSSADATITDQHSGLVLTRNGTVNTLANGAPDGGSCIDFPTGGTSNVYLNASVRPLDSYSESYTVNIWVRNVAISPTNGNWYINHRDASVNLYFNLATLRNPDPQLFLSVLDRNANFYFIAYPYTFINEWVMLTMVVRNHTVEMWVNGSIYGSQVRVMEQQTANAPFAIGNGAWAQSSSLQHQGQLFAAGVWNRALLPIDIKRLYNGGAGLRYENL
jgi:hypothetical protein